MGYDLSRFPDVVDELLVCAICKGVFRDPVQGPCEHAFCRPCICEWLNHQQTCPIDRQTITTFQLVPVPRILKNMLHRLSICCENKSRGCEVILKLDTLETHTAECEFNPKKLVMCSQGCGITIPKDEEKDHNCVKELRLLLDKQADEMMDLQKVSEEHLRQIKELQREATIFKDYARAMRAMNPYLGGPEAMERMEVIRWSNTLPRARVTRWGGMISTPDVVLQNSVKMALVESGCPYHILEDLMANCHERNWPHGLCSLETRQYNRRNCERYVCKRIPGRQAVVVLQVDNMYAGEHMIAEPGLVMIFAHGIE